MQETWVGKIPWKRERLWRRKWQPTPVLLSGKSHGQRSLVRYSLWGRKESDTTERLYLLTYLLTYPLQYSGVENSMDCIVHGVAKSQTRLSNFFTFFCLWRAIVVQGQSNKIEASARLPSNLLWKFWNRQYLCNWWEVLGFWRLSYSAVDSALFLYLDKDNRDRSLLKLSCFQARCTVLHKYVLN